MAGQARGRLERLCGLRSLQWLPMIGETAEPDWSERNSATDEILALGWWFRLDILPIPATPEDSAMPLEMIHPVLVLTFFGIWIMAGAILVREP